MAACWPTSAKDLIKNCWCATNIWRLRIGFCEPGSKAGYNYRTGEKRTLAEIAHRMGHKALAEVVAVAAKPDTILRWFRKLVAAQV